MDVFKLLKQDHDEVSKLFKKIEDAKGKGREKTFKELARQLTVHTALEERLFYPRLREEEKLREMINEALEEHHVVDVTLEELSQLSMDDEQWDAKLTVLKELVEHHVEEEEKELFPKAQKLLEKEEAIELAETIEEEKKEMLKGSDKGTKEIFGRLGL